MIVRAGSRVISPVRTRQSFNARHVIHTGHADENGCPHPVPLHVISALEFVLPGTNPHTLSSADTSDAYSYNFEEDEEEWIPCKNLAILFQVPKLE